MPPTLEDPTAFLTHFTRIAQDLDGEEGTEWLRLAFERDLEGLALPAVDVAVERPGKLFVDYRDDVSDRVVWFTEGRVTILDPVASTYAEISGPRDIDGMVAKLEADYGFSMPLGELAESNPDQVLTRGVEVAHYVGIHDVEGIYCHHVVLQRKDIDIQVFVEVGDKPVPRKIVFDYPNRTGWPQYTASITEWSFKPPAKDLFEPKVPKDSAKVEFLPIQEGR